MEKKFEGFNQADNDREPIEGNQGISQDEFNTFVAQNFDDMTEYQQLDDYLGETKKGFIWRKNYNQEEATEDWRISGDYNPDTGIITASFLKGVGKGKEGLQRLINSGKDTRTFTNITDFQTAGEEFFREEVKQKTGELSEDSEE